MPIFSLFWSIFSGSQLGCELVLPTAHYEHLELLIVSKGHVNGRRLDAKFV